MITAAPVTTERIEVLDAVRGAAVFGILLINVESLSGFSFLAPAERAALPQAGWDPLVAALLAVLVEGKFYALFSLLFGVGFAVFVERAAARGADAVRLFRRRLLGLLIIGLVHTLLIWFGDILVTYALLGFALIPFLSTTTRTLLRWATALLLLPVLVYLAGAAVISMAGLPAGQEIGTPPILAAATEKLAHGSYFEVVQANVVYTAANFARRIGLMFFPRMFAMFLLGIWLWRQHLPADIERQRPFLRRLTWWGFAIGAPFAVLGALADRAAGSPVVLWCGQAARSIAIPAMAIAYAAGLSLVFHRLPAIGRALAPVGRTALSNYLLQSIAGVIVFYGIGFGWFGRVSLVTALTGAIGFFALQILASRLWLSRVPFGPAERAWRMFTYRLVR